MKLCEEIVVKRCYLIYDLSDLIKGIYLHGFSDASRSAYAAYIYLQSVTQWGNVTVKFVAAKSRVIPIKKSFTFPTLELLGNYILSKLICNVYNGIWDDIEVKDILCWSDSQISLAWIKDVNSEFKILMQLQEFERIKLKGGMKNCFCFSFLWKNNRHLKAATGSCSVKKVFWGVFLPSTLRCSG